MIQLKKVFNIFVLYKSSLKVNILILIEGNVLTGILNVHGNVTLTKRLTKSFKG